jgi:hypothetical protein
MVGMFSLWLPVLLSGVLVFIASSVIHMLLGYHKSDFVKLPQEESIMEVLYGFDTPPGNYVMPHAGSTKEMGSEAFVEKTKRGPVAFMTFLPKGPSKMTGSLILWFVYSIIVGFIVAYLTGRALGPGAEYLHVFRISGTTAFIAYALAHWQHTIWYKLSWKVALKNNIDGFVYAVLTAGCFAWLWPGI